MSGLFTKPVNPKRLTGFFIGNGDGTVALLDHPPTTMSHQSKKPFRASLSMLPSYRMGPYQLRVVAAPRASFVDKRRRIEVDWNSGIVRLCDKLKESRALSLLTRHLITAIHYRSGLNDHSDEESFAHSFASGLVELALGQRAFFSEFLALVERQLKPRAGWCAAYLTAHRVAVPKRIACGERACTIHFVPAQQCSKQGAYGFYTVGKGIVELSDQLSGANLALIALHEKMHFMHECAGLNDRSSEATFKTVQAKLLLNSLRDNPGYWRWWLSLLLLRPD